MTDTSPAVDQSAPEPPTTRCARCTHPKRDHDGRADHRVRFSPLVAGDPWCHACDAPCDYAEQPLDTGQTAPHGPHSPSGALEGAATEERAAQARTAARVFRLQRDRDISGVSGTGIVADGCQWPDGTVTIRWRGDRPSTVNWDSIEHAEAVHGHGGATRIVMADTPDSGPDSPDTPAWTDGDPLMEAIAAAIWEQCRTEGTSLVVDDPRNIASVAAHTIRTHTDSPDSEADNSRTSPCNEPYAAALERELTRYARTETDPGTGSDVGDQVAIVLAVRDRHMDEVAAENDVLRHRAERLRARAEQAEDLLRVAHDTSNRSEAERAAAEQRATQAGAAVARIRQMVDHWEQRLPETIRTPAVVSAIRAALDGVPAGGPLTTGPINWAEDAIPDTPPTTLAQAQERHRQLLHRRRESIAAITHAWERKEIAAIRDLVNLASKEGCR